MDRGVSTKNTGNETIDYLSSRMLINLLPYIRLLDETISIRVQNILILWNCNILQTKNLIKGNFKVLVLSPMPNQSRLLILCSELVDRNIVIPHLLVVYYLKFTIGDLNIYQFFNEKLIL